MANVVSFILEYSLLLAVALISFILQYCFLKFAKHLLVKLIPIYGYVMLLILLLLSYYSGGGTWIDFSSLTLVLIHISLLIIALPIMLAFCVYIIRSRKEK